MGLAIAVLLVVITLLSSYFFWARTWWFPANISTHGSAIDHQFVITLIVAGIIFIVVQFALAWCVWKYRNRNDGRKAAYSHGNTTLEIVGVVVALILFIGINEMGYKTWAEIHFAGAQPGAMPIEIWGQQFEWNFRYPGPDGKFGPVHVEKVDDASGNALGLDRSHDEASIDDIVTATLGLPVNREIQLILRSKDVTHSFFVRELRIKQDLVPGMEIPIHFTATKVGRYELACAELCGLGHYKMRAFVDVMSQADFDKWLQGQAAAQ